jgi:hypothetical protein
LIGNLEVLERQVLVAALVEVPDEFTITPMRDLAWRMGTVGAKETDLSTLVAEVVAAAESFPARVLASSRDDRPGIRRVCGRLGLLYGTVER